ncbi:MAG: P-II family nitrogen regulator [Xanthomonadales bacterium]|nr:P-II family nitrogen regulator [Xanthomonadales bacterium]
MSEMIENHAVSIVTAVLPRRSSGRVINRVFNEGDPSVLLMQARGTLAKDRWYQSILPLVSPEKSILQFYVPDWEVDHIMEEVVDSGRLHMAGAGAVFSVPCEEFFHSSDLQLWSGGREQTDRRDASHTLKENLTAIFCIVQPEQSDVVARAAMQAGGHGPIVHYCEGRGLRDRLGWLRITKKRTKEELLLIVDNADADAVVEAMVSAGRIDTPGRGFLFRMPVEKGLISIASTYGSVRQQASMQQIVAAIDQLQGGTNWRDRSVIEGVAAKSAGLKLFGKIRQRTALEDQVILSCVAARKVTPDIMRTVTRAGAPGANVAQAKFIEEACEKTSQGVRLTTERGIVHIVLERGHAETVARAVRDYIAEQGLTTACVYTQPVTRAHTYLGAETAAQAS